ncbi:GGDEF domain-containing protein [Desulfovibrio aminophilus]|nr:GGDEF domain-containing protein [Desulfovibrio aminophilus]MCM0756564.1 GGDEF domain-containing protein [Desulfovibrio aminophilus]
MTLDQVVDSPQTLRRFSPSPVVLRLMVEAARPEPDFQILAEIIRADPALAATILALVNSPFFGLPKKVSDIQRAAVVLGSRELLKTALLVSLRKDREQALLESGYDAAEDWRMALWSAVAAEALARRICPEQADLAYICALLKDVSLLFLRSASPELLIRRDPGPLTVLAQGQLAAEREAWGLDHPGLSRLLLGKWGLPPEIGEGLSKHHDLEEMEEREPLQRAVILATHWAEVELSTGRGPFPAVRFSHRLRTALGLRETELEELRQGCLVRFEALLKGLGLGDGADEGFFRHSIKAMQEAYFLSMDLPSAEGGVEAVARLVARQLALSFDLRTFDLALRSPHNGGYHLFHSTPEGGLSAEPGPAPSAELAWSLRLKGAALRSGDRKWGEFRHHAQDVRPGDAGALDLYLRFVGQAYETYCARQAVMEERASAFDSLPLAVARLGGRGEVVDTNRRFRELADLAPGQSRGRKLERILEDRLGLYMGREWQEFLEDEARPAFNRIVCFTDRSGPGKGREACAYLSAQRETSGGQARILFLVEGLRDLSNMEVQALRRRDFLERLIGSMRDKVFTVDERGTIGFSSLEGEEGRGESLFELFTPEATFTGAWGPEFLELPAPPAVEATLARGEGGGSYELIFSRLERSRGRERAALVVARDLSAVRRLEKELKMRAIYDGLTGLFNHAQFHSILEREVRRAQRTGRPMGLIFFDLDGFKAINDTKGHQAGDAILRLIGEILTREVRQGMDFPCRYGGDEFAVVVTEVGDRELELVGERLRQAVSAQFAGKVTISAGLTGLGTQDTPDSLLNRADRAAYSAKGAGGDTVVWAK